MNKITVHLSDARSRSTSPACRAKLKGSNLEKCWVVANLRPTLVYVGRSRVMVPLKDLSRLKEGLNTTLEPCEECASVMRAESARLQPVKAEDGPAQEATV